MPGKSLDHFDAEAFFCGEGVQGPLLDLFAWVSEAFRSWCGLVGVPHLDTNGPSDKPAFWRLSSWKPDSERNRYAKRYFPGESHPE